MVHRKTNQRAALKTNHRNWPLAAILCILILIIILSCILAYNIQNAVNNTVQETQDQIAVPSTNSLIPNKIDFQTMVDDWANSATDDRSVIIYDLDREELVGAYNSSESYNMDSLYKLFVVYEGYQKIQRGEWEPNDTLECLDLAIRESNSICAEKLWSKIGEEELDNIIKNNYGILNTEISSFLSNPEDIARIMKLFYILSKTMDESLGARMKDSFLNQPATTYNWRQGLPSGFNEANVYDKVGWDFNANTGTWETYHDAAIVEFPTINRHFIIVVMTSHVAFEEISKLGSLIEKKVLVSTKEL